MDIEELAKRAGKAYEEKNYVEAARLFYEGAEAGDA